LEPSRIPGAAAAEVAADRRLGRRADGNPPLTVLGRSAVVHDISRGGVCLVGEGLLPGTELDLALRDQTDHSEIQARAEVVWLQDGKAGLRWVNLTPDQDQWLMMRFQLWLADLLGDE
jgi:hypothetical protein